MSLTRRSLFAAAAGLVAVACGPVRRHRPPPGAAEQDDVGTALAAEQALLADYDQAIASLDAVAAGPLSVARQRHAEHVEALQGAGGTPSPLPPPAASRSASLASTLRGSADALRASAISATSGRTAALLASIAAEHAADATTTPRSV